MARIPDCIALEILDLSSSNNLSKAAVCSSIFFVSSLRAAQWGCISPIMFLTCAYLAVVNLPEFKTPITLSKSLTISRASLISRAPIPFILSSSLSSALSSCSAFLAALCSSVSSALTLPSLVNVLLAPCSPPPPFLQSIISHMTAAINATVANPKAVVPTWPKSLIKSSAPDTIRIR